MGVMRSTQGGRRDLKIANFLKTIGMWYSPVSIHSVWGFYENGSFGILARQGALGTFPERYTLFEQVLDEVIAWADCSNP